MSELALSDELRRKGDLKIPRAGQSVAEHAKGRRRERGRRGRQRGRSRRRGAARRRVGRSRRNRRDNRDERQPLQGVLHALTHATFILLVSGSRPKKTPLFRKPALGAKASGTAALLHTRHWARMFQARMAPRTASDPRHLKSDSYTFSCDIDGVAVTAIQAICSPATPNSSATAGRAPSNREFRVRSIVPRRRTTPCTIARSIGSSMWKEGSVPDVAPANFISRASHTRAGISASRSFIGRRRHRLLARHIERPIGARMGAGHMSRGAASWNTKTAHEPGRSPRPKFIVVGWIGKTRPPQ